MQKIKIRLPATLTNFGASIRSLGLALNLYAHVDISPRKDERLFVETSGVGAGHYAVAWRHPVVLAMMRVFQKLERAPLGVTIKVDNQIPINSGLGAETAFMVAGVIGANNLMGNIFSHDEIVELTAQICPDYDGAVASMLGGLTATLVEDETVMYRSLPLESIQFVVTVPEIDDYSPVQPSSTINYNDVLANLQRIPLMIEALQTGDIHHLANVLTDKIQAPAILPALAPYAHVVKMAREAGAIGMTTSGNGPAMVFLVEDDPYEVMEAIDHAFLNLATEATTLLVSTDTQGVVISMMQSV